MTQLAEVASKTTTGSTREGMVEAHRRRNMAIRVFILILGTIFALYPVLLVIGASFDARNTLVGATIIPRVPSLANYQELFSSTNTPILRWLLNSIIVSGVSTVLTLILTTLAAYSFSRFRFADGRRDVGIFHREGAAEAAADFRLLHLAERQAVDACKQAPRRIMDLELAQA